MPTAAATAGGARQCVEARNNRRSRGNREENVKQRSWHARVHGTAAVRAFMRNALDPEGCAETARNELAASATRSARNVRVEGVCAVRNRMSTNQVAEPAFRLVNSWWLRTGVVSTAVVASMNMRCARQQNASRDGSKCAKEAVANEQELRATRGAAEFAQPATANQQTSSAR